MKSLESEWMQATDIIQDCEHILSDATASSDQIATWQSRFAPLSSKVQRKKYEASDSSEELAIIADFDGFDLDNDTDVPIELSKRYRLAILRQQLAASSMANLLTELRKFHRELTSAITGN